MLRVLQKVPGYLKQIKLTTFVFVHMQQKQMVKAALGH